MQTTGARCILSLLVSDVNDNANVGRFEGKLDATYFSAEVTVIEK